MSCQQCAFTKHFHFVVFFLCSFQKLRPLPPPTACTEFVRSPQPQLQLSLSLFTNGYHPSTTFLTICKQKFFAPLKHCTTATKVFCYVQPINSKPDINRKLLPPPHSPFFLITIDLPSVILFYSTLSSTVETRCSRRTYGSMFIVQSVATDKGTHAKKSLLIGIEILMFAYSCNLTNVQFFLSIFFSDPSPHYPPTSLNPPRGIHKN